MDDHSPKTSEANKFTSGKSNLVELRKERTSSSFSLASLELLSNYGSRTQRLKGKLLHNTIHRTTCNSSGGQKLSTVEIMKIARSGYINQTSDYLSTLIKPFYGDQSSISSKAAEDLELALILFASAEKVANLEFDRAIKLLTMCFHLASPMGNSVQRVVYYFAEALQERIARQKRIILSKSRESNKKWISNLDMSIMSVCASTLAYKQELPFVLVIESVGIQAILESVALAKRIHLVDLGHRSGAQWSSLMQALAVRDECPS